MNKRLVIVILQKVAEPQDPPDKSAGKDCGRHEGKAQNRNRKVKLPSEACEPVMVGSDMQPRLFTLAPRDKIPWHCRSECADHYFVLEGTLTIMTRKLKREKSVRVGNRYRIAPGTPHVISNRSGADCRFLLLQGIGKRDRINAGNR